MFDSSECLSTLIRRRQRRSWRFNRKELEGDLRSVVLFVECCSLDCRLYVVSDDGLLVEAMQRWRQGFPDMAISVPWGLHLKTSYIDVSR